jgi:hypothetical protein
MIRDWAIFGPTGEVLQPSELLRKQAILDRHSVCCEDPHRVHVWLGWPEFQSPDGDVARPDFEHVRGGAAIDDARASLRIRGANHQGHPSLSPMSDRARPPIVAGSEHQLLSLAAELGAKNRISKSYIGAGFADCITPPVILRNILENPGWYTQYTPYQAEISQGRLEALVNFQTMVEDLTALPLANASLLDEATAAAEAMHMCFAQSDGKREVFWVEASTHPQTIGRAHMISRLEELIEYIAENGGWFATLGEIYDATVIPK